MRLEHHHLAQVPRHTHKSQHEMEMNSQVNTLRILSSWIHTRILGRSHEDSLCADQKPHLEECVSSNNYCV